MTQTPEGETAPDDASQFVDAFIERAEQACRYAFKYQNGDGIDAETMAEVCEKAIRPHLERHGHIAALLVRLRVAALQPTEIARANLIEELKGLAGPRACEEAIAFIAADGTRLAKQADDVVALTKDRDAWQARAVASEAEAKSERERRHAAVADIWRLADPDALPSSSDEREALDALAARISKMQKGGQSRDVDVRNFPPGPWTLSWSATFCENGMGHIYLVDANGKKIAPIWGAAEVKETLARRILDTCNKAFFDVTDVEGVEK